MNDNTNIQSPTQDIKEKYGAFWEWFVQYEQQFYEAVKGQKDIENIFFAKLSPRLHDLQEGIFFLTGMYDKETVELILTPDGNLKNIVFVEELVDKAPQLPNWQFTALKPPTNIESASIEIGDLRFGAENLHFYANDHPAYPDEIDLTIVYDNFSEAQSELITNGIYIFLDNYLGELKSVTLIDNINIIGKESAEQDLVPITKLKDFLIWREKEFIEKYEENYHSSDQDQFTMYEAELENGLPLIASMNTSLLNWDNKPSHPFIARILIPYEGNDNGMPTQEIFDLTNAFEDSLMKELPAEKGYLHIGRQTGDGMKEIYFVAKEFRQLSKTIQHNINAFSNDLNFFYEIYKDKYWQTFERYGTVVE